MIIIINLTSFNFLLKNQNFLLPVKVYMSNRRSPLKLISGYLKVAGLFFSKTKCPTHANPYPTIGTIRKFPIPPVKIALINKSNEIKVPITWSLLLA
jgi:hypothetical protein